MLTPFARVPVALVVAAVCIACHAASSQAGETCSSTGDCVDGLRCKGAKCIASPNANCEAIEDEIAHAAALDGIKTTGICASSDSHIKEKYGEACSALKACFANNPAP